ncbi:MAG: hypothetical protein ABIF12_03650 [bacterium]
MKNALFKKLLFLLLFFIQIAQPQKISTSIFNKIHEACYDLDINKLTELIGSKKDTTIKKYLILLKNPEKYTVVQSAVFGVIKKINIALKNLTTYKDLLKHLNTIIINFDKILEFIRKKTENMKLSVAKRSLSGTSYLNGDDKTITFNIYLFNHQDISIKSPIANLIENFTLIVKRYKSEIKIHQQSTEIKTLLNKLLKLFIVRLLDNGGSIKTRNAGSKTNLEIIMEQEDISFSRWELDKYPGYSDI